MAKKTLNEEDVKDLMGDDADASQIVAKQPEPKAAKPIRVDSGLRPTPRGKAKIGTIQPTKAVKQVFDEEEVLPESENEMVEIFVDEELFINGQRIYGMVQLPRHQARSIMPMIQAKKRADIEMFVGHKFLVQKLANQKLVIRELDGESEFPFEKSGGR